MFWLRKRVPDDLRDRVGKREEKRSLKTKDAAEAKRLLLRALSELELRWANLREREAHDTAQAVYDWWIKSHRDNPSDQVHWATEIGAELWPPSQTLDDGLSLGEAIGAEFLDQIKRDPLEKWCMVQADALLAVRGLVIDEDSRLKLAKAVAARNAAGKPRA